MLTRVTMKIAGETQIARAFDALADDARDLRKPLQRTHEHLRGVIGQQFLSEGGHSGHQWQRLSDTYAARKASDHGDGLPILVASDKLRAAWLARAPLELSPHRLVMGPPAGSEEEVKSIAHQTGAGHLPVRKIVDLTLDDRREVDRIFVSYLSAQARRLFGRG